jgi:hypothetical protein
MVSAIPQQLCKTIEVFPSTTASLHLSASPLSFWPTHQSQPKLTRHLIQNASGAWDLTSNARPAFHFFSLVPNQFPSRAGTHDDVPVRMGVDLAIPISIRRLAAP